MAAFKDKFYHRWWARYNLAKPGTIKLVPPEHVRRAGAKDYEGMRRMIFGERRISRISSSSFGCSKQRSIRSDEGSEHHTAAASFRSRALSSSVADPAATFPARADSSSAGFNRFGLPPVRTAGMAPVNAALNSARPGRK